VISSPKSGVRPAQEVTEGLLTLRGFGSNSDNLPDI
jgi:hypothetical protein